MTTPSGTDPIFDLPTPLLFAHRGGAGEVPESTALAFEHALTFGSNVLELDVQLTANREIVVWHGPGLDNVFLAAAPYRQGEAQKLLRRISIHRLHWNALKDATWVIGPGESPPYRQEDNRKLLSFDAFITSIERLEQKLGLQIPTALNIELKPARGWSKALPELISLLDERTPKRKIAIVVTVGVSAALVRRAIASSKLKDRYARNVPVAEQLRFFAGHWLKKLLPWNPKAPRQRFAGRAFQTSHRLVTAELVRDIHARGGAVHAFLTPFPLCKGIDQLPEWELRAPLFELLDMGLDGIMTDFPERVSQLMREWRNTRGAAATPSLTPSTTSPHPHSPAHAPR